MAFEIPMRGGSFPALEGKVALSRSAFERKLGGKNDQLYYMICLVRCMTVLLLCTL